MNSTHGRDFLLAHQRELLATWKEWLDQKSGRTYFQNLKTNAVTWERPNLWPGMGPVRVAPFVCFGSKETNDFYFEVECRLLHPLETDVLCTYRLARDSWIRFQYAAGISTTFRARARSGAEIFTALSTSWCCLKSQRKLRRSESLDARTAHLSACFASSIRPSMTARWVLTARRRVLTARRSFACWVLTALAGCLPPARGPSFRSRRAPRFSQRVQTQHQILAEEPAAGRQEFLD